MKIGVLTYHNNRNKGAVLQGYCLKKALEEITKVRTEIIDYRTLSKETKRIISKNPVILKKNITDYINTESFYRERDCLSSRRIITNNYKKAIRFIENLNYDMIVTGSDEIWKAGKDKKFFFSHRPFPNAYFLNKSINSPKVSYAASVGQTDLQKLSSYEERFLKKHLGSFDRISVRDNHAEHFLLKLGIENVARVPDPTILVSIPVCDVSPILESEGVSPDKPMLGIHRVKHPIIKKVCDKYRRRGFQILTPRTHPFADAEFFSKVDPIQYYSLYKHFDFVITSSLHSTIFSIKNNTPFVTVETETDYGKNIESKTHSLLQDFDLLDRHIDATRRIPTDFIESIEKCEQELDKQHIKKKTSSLKKQGHSYISELKEMLNDSQT